MEVKVTPWSPGSGTHPQTRFHEFRRADHIPFRNLMVRISIQFENISNVDNFFLNEYFLIKMGTKNEPSLKTPNLQGFLLTPNSFGAR